MNDLTLQRRLQPADGDAPQGPDTLALELDVGDPLLAEINLAALPAGVGELAFDLRVKEHRL